MSLEKSLGTKLCRNIALNSKERCTVNCWSLKIICSFVIRSHQYEVYDAEKYFIVMGKLCQNITVTIFTIKYMSRCWSVTH